MYKTWIYIKDFSAIKKAGIFGETFQVFNSMLVWFFKIIFFCFAQIINIYDHKKGVLSIGPFNYSTMDEIDLLCRLPDQFIREVGVSMNDRPKKDR